MFWVAIQNWSDECRRQQARKLSFCAQVWILNTKGKLPIETFSMIISKQSLISIVSRVINIQFSSQDDANCGAINWDIFSASYISQLVLKKCMIIVRESIEEWFTCLLISISRTAFISSDFRNWIGLSIILTDQWNCLLFCRTNQIVFCFSHLTNEIASFIDQHELSASVLNHKQNTLINRVVVLCRFCWKDGPYFAEPKRWRTTKKCDRCERIY